MNTLVLAMWTHFGVLSHLISRIVQLCAPLSIPWFEFHAFEVVEEKFGYMQFNSLGTASLIFFMYDTTHIYVFCNGLQTLKMTYSWATVGNDDKIALGKREITSYLDT